MKDLKRLFGYMGPYRADMALGMLLVVVESAFEMVIPILMSDIIDKGVMQKDLQCIITTGVQMAVCALLALVTGLLYAKYAARASYGFGARIRQAEYAKVQTYAFGNIDRFETSSLITRMTTDVSVLQNAINGGFRPMVRGPSMLVLGIVLSFWMSPELAVVFFICVPILAAVLFLVVRRIAPMYIKLQQAMDHLNNVVQECLTAIRAVKAFVRGEYEEEKFETVNTELMTVSRDTFRTAVLNLPAFQLTMYAACVLILWMGGSMILAGTLTVGRLTSFLSYVMQVMNSLMMISNVFLLMTRSLASARRVAEVLDEPVELTSPKKAVKKIPDGGIVFDHVSFKYHPDAAEYALADIDLTIRPGQTVGILGGTGSAKSTLVQLIPRLYDATEGRVLVGGVDVRDYDMEALREQVAMVLQKNVLFSGTIKENLRWGNKDATDEEMVRVCRLAQADPFIQEFPDKYDTYIEQGGTNVSGGQKQRLCIARALLKKPKILILDDSTSAVDTKTDALIRQAFLEEIPDTTKIIIAQRVSSVQDADQIVVMDGGKINAVGTHEELLKSNQIYREVYESQQKGGSEHEN